MKPSVLLSCVGVIALLICLIEGVSHTWRAEGPHTEARQTISRSKERTSRAEDEVARLEKEILALRQEVAELGARPPEQPTVERVDRERAARERGEDLAQGFQAEPSTRDSLAAESYLADRLAAAGTLRDAVKDLHCRGRTCRMEVDVTDGEVAMSVPLFLHQLVELPNVLGTDLVLSDGRRHTILFMSKSADAL